MSEFSPSKRLGQHFLIDKGALNKVIAAADLQPDETILEIGPGTGVLTLELAKRAKKVIAVEKDRNMVEMLRDKLRNFDNIELIHGDILKLKSYQLPATSYKLVANLPYYITSPVIRQFLEHTENGSLYVPSLMVLMVQKEVAQRICAHPPNMSILAVSVQFYAKPEIISYVSKNAFRPRPKVDSAILKISNLKSQISKIESEQFFRVVRVGFSHPRKQLINNLSTGLSLPRPQVRAWLQKNNIQPGQRAETLTIEDWQNLTKSKI